MKTTSLRFKLIAWNLVVLAIGIIAVSTAQSYRMVSQLERDIDNVLRDTGTQASRMGPPGMMPPNGPNPFDRRGPMGEGPGGPPPGDDHHREGPGGMLSDLRRPRFFGMDGEGMGPNRNLQPVDPEALKRASSGWEGFSNVDGVRVFTIPLREGPQIRGAVQVAHELRDVQMLRASQIHHLGLLLPAALLLAGVGAFFLADRALRPIAALTSTAKKIGASDLSQRIPIAGDDEFAELQKTFNDMIARLEGSFGELRRAYGDLEAAFEKQRQFTADASHELRTPLTRLKLATSSALATGEGYQRALEVADAAGVAMAKLIDQLLTLAQADAGSLALRHGMVDLRVAVSDAVTGFPSEREIKVSFSKEPVTVFGDASLLGRVATNLLENALRHSTEAPLVTVEVSGSEAIMEVEDSGEGIASEHLPKLFDRFYRADAARTRAVGGTGLGLAICKSIVEAHHGTIEVESRKGEGTRVKVRFPLAKNS